MKDPQIRLCIRCKRKIPNDAIYCPYCGIKQVIPKVHKPTTAKLSRQKVRPAQIDIHVLPPDSNQKQLNRDLKPARIIAYKEQMGMSDRIDNILYLSNSYYRRKFLFGKLGFINDKNMLVAFEKHGLLFIGYTMLGHFSGQNAFITKSQIKKIHFQCGRLQNLLIIQLKSMELEFPIFKLMVNQRWQRHNLMTLSQKYHG